VVASGLLGLGAVAIISGIAWLVSSYLLSHTGDIDTEDLYDDASAWAVHRLGQIIATMLYGVVIVVAALMAVTVYGYVRSWYQDPPDWIGWLLLAYAPAIVIAILGWRKLRPLRDQEAKELSSRLTGAMFVSAITSIGYAVTGAVFAGFVAATHESQWTHPSPYWLIGTGALALILPAPTLVSLAYTLPRFPTRSDPGEPPAVGPGPDGTRVDATETDPRRSTDEEMKQ
jgi:heme/copper-type cytochrome/quinol oxidase subunit 2